MPEQPSTASRRPRTPRTRARTAVGSLLAAALLGAGLTVVAATPASAHGWVGGAVVARAAASQNADRGSVANEPQSLEAPKGFPAGGPADGKLASAGGLFGGVLDQQTATRWWKNPVTTGPLTVTWQYTAPHKTTQWRYFLTKPGWDPNAPLTRSEFELIATVPHDGSEASNNPSHTITIPADRSGYQILYAVWDVADTSNAFYNTIDLDVGTGTPVTSTTPSSATGSSTAPSSSTGYPTPTSEHTHSHPETTTSAPVTTTPATTAPSTTTPTPSTTTAPATTTTPTTGPTAPAWNPFGRYRIGDRVSFEGREYVCRQNYQGWGDPSWITALALWTPA